jgi:serine/threonine-protein kinase
LDPVTPSKRHGVPVEPTADHEPTEIAVRGAPWDASSISEEVAAATIHDGEIHGDDDTEEPVVDDAPSLHPTDHFPIPNKPVTSSDRPRAQAAPAPDDAPLESGTMLGDYRIEAQIGEGGMGVVYAAVHPLIGKRAAVKVLKAELCRAAFNVERFIDEARIVNQIGHPNIVDVFAFGQTRDGRSYFVMEWLKGESLRARIARTRLDFSEICEIVRPLARALEAAHEQGVIHRDLKPDNIFLVDRRGDAPDVKLLDFGIAKLVKQEHRMERTATGAMVGTPQYIAPEQAKGYAIDARVDIYALGGILFELLTGRPPYVADNAMELVAKHLMETVPHPATLAEIPPELDDLVVRMLSKTADGRPSLAEVAAIIERTSSLDRTNVRPRSRAGTPTPSPVRSSHASGPSSVSVSINVPTPTPVSSPALDAVRAKALATAAKSSALPVTDLTETIRSPQRANGLGAKSIVLLGVGFVVAAALAYVVVSQLDRPKEPAIAVTDGSSTSATATDPVVAPNVDPAARGTAHGADAKVDATAMGHDAKVEAKNGGSVDPTNAGAAKVEPKLGGSVDPKLGVDAKPGGKVDAQVATKIGVDGKITKSDPPVDIPAKPRKKAGRLELSIGGAKGATRVLIDGTAGGLAKELTPGVHTVQVTAPGMKPQSFTVHIEEGKTLAKRISLEPEKPAKDDLMVPGSLDSSKKER